ncbi:hypothetical protein DFH08DRAFT_1088616 [Mycena albidolilacea]|uniref:BTB domain-containing protein n=1 Tax=Mycena albidolilacea TaxID=1033008 RepID=A0AAD7EAK4_9AGAR|nr:hypothetical protein DFH08DRAFT_1088616 [Mycena albidolilacea]
MSTTSNIAHSTTPPFSPLAPFDDPGADVILRSSDGTDFHVYRVVLSLASPFFKEMFGLPQPPFEPEVPTLPMAESAVVLDRMLRFWYPGAQPIAIPTLDELRDTFESLIVRYDMQFIVPFAKRQLREYVQEHPVAVFAIACRHEWKDLAREAAKSSLSVPIHDVCDSPRPSHLNDMTADTYHSLLRYHSRCARVARVPTSTLEWINRSDETPGANCTERGDYSCPFDDRTWDYANAPGRPLVGWFAGHLKRLNTTLANSPLVRLDSPEVLTLAIKQMAACPFCKTNGFERLAKFTVALKAKIDRDIDSVELELNF